MSGIFGTFCNSIHTQDKNKKKLILWNNAYGRDAKQIFEKNNIQIGCCLQMLATHTTTCPILHMNSMYAAIDLLLYNREELIIKCNAPTSISNEELLLSYLIQFGMSALKDVNGDFSGVIYDENAQTLTLFRDHMGIRPLYYYADNSFMAFSTDIRGLLGLDGVDSSLNEDWIYRTLSGYFVDSVTSTEYQNIFCVSPASYITFSIKNEKISQEIHSYWQLGKKKIHYTSFELYKAKLKELVMDSIQRRLQAIPGKAGAELSGGLDSGVIGILIHRLGRDCVYFSWSVDPNEIPYADHDERLIIKDICKQEHIHCHYSQMKSDRSMNSLLARQMQSLGFSLDENEPPALRYAMPPYINAMALCDSCACMHENGASVIFTGHGGDEGISHRSSPYEMFYHHEYYHFFRSMWSSTHGQKGRIFRTLKACKNQLGPKRRTLTGAFCTVFATPEFLNKNFRSHFSEKDMPALHFSYDPIRYIADGGSRNRLDNVALLGAYNNIRYIVPYLDYRVIDFAVSIPRHLYLKNSHNRFIFREAFRDIMPKSLYSVHIKEDMSAKNYPSNPNWYKEFAEMKAIVNKKLDRTLWSKYLDFAVIDQWMQKGKPSEEERDHDSFVLMNLFYCVMAQNLIEKTSEIF